MLALVLTLTLATAPDLRSEPRIEAGIGLGGGVGTAGLGVAGGLALHANIGAIVRDRLLLSLRVHAASVVVVLVTGAGVSADVVVGERWTVGLGFEAAFIGALMPGGSSSLAVLAPMRATYALAPPRDGGVGRRGFNVFAEVSPGVAVIRSVPYPSLVALGPAFAFAASLGIGYAWF